jgi:hypothetical protein
MKYQVQISYTNPSHEHVTLRRRVETVTRLVEASTEGEALNRAANQQRALGFRIQEAKVLQPLQPISLKEEVEQVDEANMQFDADKRDAGYKMSPAVRKAQGESDRLSKVVKPVQAGTLAAQRRRAEMKKEAVEPGETRVVNKAVKTSKKATKAAEKMVSAAKGKLNKINVKPTMDLTGQEKTHSKA